MYVAACCGAFVCIAISVALHFPLALAWDRSCTVVVLCLRADDCKISRLRLILDAIESCI